MFKITIEATTAKDRELLPELFMHLCYGLEADANIKLRSKDADGKKWNGHSGGDDTYFGLSGKVVKVEVKK